MINQQYYCSTIREFLEKQDIFWDGRRKNEHQKHETNLIFAEIYLPGENVAHDVYFDIDDITFKIYEKNSSIKHQSTTYMCKLYKDLSLEWIKHQRHALSWIQYVVRRQPERAKELKASIEQYLEYIKSAEKDGLVFPKGISMAAFVRDETRYWWSITNAINNALNCGEQVDNSSEQEKE